MLYKTFLISNFFALTLGTNVHVNTGCIDINTTPVCQNQYLNIGSGSATFFARFNGDERTNQVANPGCQMYASWPTNYVDIYFGTDNCLYDAGGNQINGQCCQAGTGNGVQVLNPYYGH
ncbi:hypothetical protein F5884DRAFT_406045 [Xylogone sp. PMI_703]|nr:hypothetical protein F5884DRAFT_406045 [Xylogone sp. PMI_703]